MSDTARAELIGTLTTYVREELLGEQDAVDLTPATPLLEWGILNSLETVRLLAFLRREHGIRVPATEVNAHNFGTLDALADLLLSLSARTA